MRNQGFAAKKIRDAIHMIFEPERVPVFWMKNVQHAVNMIS